MNVTHRRKIVLSFKKKIEHLRNTRFTHFRIWDSHLQLSALIPISHLARVCNLNRKLARFAIAFLVIMYPRDVETTFWIENRTVLRNRALPFSNPQDDPNASVHRFELRVQIFLRP